MTKPILVDVLGRMAHLVRMEGGWQLFLLGNEGKKRLVQEFAVAPSMSEAEVLDYLDDLYHEWASESHPRVRPVDPT